MRVMNYIIPMAIIIVCIISASCSSGDSENNNTDGDLDHENTETDDDSMDKDIIDSVDSTQETDLESDGDTDLDSVEDEHQENTDTNDVEATNLATVFSVNPVATPDMIQVELSAADDSGGVLTSPEDANGLRRIAVYSCIDDGKTNTINVGMGPETQRICSLVQRANKEQNGNYIYNDYTKALNGLFDPDDIHAEVEAFYHANKFYDFFTQAEVNVFDTIPNRHGNNLDPINFVVNFQAPTPENSDSLMPTSLAMYLPIESLSVGMAKIYGLEGPEGDIIVLGQGSKTDFSYDGETIYHEMGHLMNQALANIKHTVSFDKYGMNRIQNSLEQGLSETMTFLVSGKSELFDFLGPGFVRDADNDLSYPESYIGVDQSDAMILAGAMWEVFEYMIEEDIAETQFTRMLLLTLQSLDANTEYLTFSTWAQAFMATMETEGQQQHKASVQAIFDSRGLETEERSRSLTAGSEGFVLYLGGAYQAMWNSVLSLEMNNKAIMPVSTALIQLKSGNFETAKSCTLSAKMIEPPGGGNMYPESKNWDLRLFVRANETVAYTKTADWKATVEYDKFVSTVLENDGSVSFEIAFDQNQTLYLHPVNLGTSPMFLTNIQLKCP